MKLHLRQPKTRIEMLPLIDIVFLLLVFFIYAMLSMVVHHAMPVKLPASTTAALDRENALSVTVKADGSLFIDRDPVALADLTARLKEEALAGEVPAVLVFGDRSLPYQRLFQVLDQIRLAGIDRISLQAEAEPE
ncbi:MAG: biopolymer transporter ExbD [Desulfobacteraceae bacterium]|jgi:biopolymer transport protein ExbD